jgi:hypothetical protein
MNWPHSALPHLVFLLVGTVSTPVEVKVDLFSFNDG